MSTITTYMRGLFRRGDYIAVTDTAVPAVRGRITDATGNVLTFRNEQRWRVVEWCFARAEDVILWPLADLKQKMRAKP